MSELIDPTVGATVWYWPAPNEPLRSLNNFSHGAAQPMAAQVVYAWGTTLVNLVVTDHEGRQVPRLNVRLLQCEDKPVAGEPHCAWPPTGR